MKASGLISQTHGRSQTSSDPGATLPSPEMDQGGQGRCSEFHSEGTAPPLEGFDQRDLCSFRLKCPSLTTMCKISPNYMNCIHLLQRILQAGAL